MIEFSTTRHNPLIDPFLHTWSWQIPLYLFLGGLVAGMMIISGYFLFSGRYKETNCSCYYLPRMSFLLISLGMLFLFFDLEHKQFVWRLYTTFQITSPMSWGAWILLLVYPVLLANMLLRISEKFGEKYPFLKNISEKMNSHHILIRNIGVINMLVGGVLGMYTGILLSSLGARPLWNTSILWLLFLVSGLSGAAAFVHLIAKNVHERELLAKSDNGFLIIELFVIAMMFIGMLTNSRAHKEAAMLLLSGPFAASFWVLVIGLGIVIPLILQLLAVSHKIHHTPVAPILVIIGGIILRFVIVYAGEFSHWSRLITFK